MYKHIIMDKAQPTIYQSIAPAHRAIWRGDIFWWLLIVFWYFNHPDDRTFWGPLELMILAFGFSLYHIISETRHPRPNDLGFSAPAVAKYWYLGFAVLFTVALTVSNTFAHIQNDWLWLSVALLATALAYYLRPRS